MRVDIWMEGVEGGWEKEKDGSEGVNGGDRHTEVWSESRERS